MKLDDRSSVTLVVLNMPMDLELAHLAFNNYRDHKAIREILVALDEGCESYYPEWCSQENVSLAFEEFDSSKNSAVRMNTLVSRAKNQNVLLLEEAAIFNSSTLRNALQTVDESGSACVEFARFELPVRPGTSAIDLEIERYSAIEINKFASGAALLMRREDFLLLRGFDERSSHQDVLFRDLISRYQRNGGFLHEGDSHELATYCMAKGQNRANIHLNHSDVKHRIELISKDRTIYRNLRRWSVPSELRPPLVSVAIATHNREQLLAESIKSVLAQSFQEFEIVVVDDGSDNPEAIREVIARIGDPRIRLFRNERSRGVAAARNLAADESKCPLTAVHDDDDLMLPDRILDGLAPLSDEVDATYGGWVNFDDENGDLVGFLTKTGFSSELNSFSGQAPGHSTWLVPTRYIQTLRYDERLTASVDHNLATRMVWRGVKWLHVERFMYLRRVHPKQITTLDSQGQKIGHQLTLLGNEFLSSPAERNALAQRGKALLFPKIPGAKDLFNSVGAFLPDHLVTRDIEFTGNVTNSLVLAEAPDRSIHILEDRDLIKGRAVFEVGTIEDATWDDFVRLRKAGLSNWQIKNLRRLNSDVAVIDHFDAESDLEEEAISIANQHVFVALEKRLYTLQQQFHSAHPDGVLLLERSSSSLSEDIPEWLRSSVFARRIVSAGEFGIRSTVRAFGFDNLSAAFLALEDMPTNTGSTLLFVPELSRDDIVAAKIEVQEKVLDLSIKTDDSGISDRVV